MCIDVYIHILYMYIYIFRLLPLSIHVNIYIYIQNRHWPSIAGMSTQSHRGDEEDGRIGLSSRRHYIYIYIIYIYIYIYQKTI